MDKNKIKIFVDALMGVMFIVCFVSGLNRQRIHIASSYALLALVIIHLILNWVWIKAMVLCKFRKKENEKSCKVK